MIKADHGYANARIRAMKSRLLDKSFFEGLLGTKNVTEVIVALEQTVYGREIHEEVLRSGGPTGVEEGLRRNTAETLQKILKILSPGARELIGTLVGRWDIQNLKTILRGKHIGATVEEIVTSLAPAGIIPEATLRELAKQPDVRGAIDLMATWSIPYARPLTANFGDYQHQYHLQILEFALDEFYYRSVLAKLNAGSLDTGLVREVIKREIDFTNIMTLLRLTKEEVGPEEKERYLVDGGKLDLKFLKKLALEQDIDDLIAVLKKTAYGPVLEEGWQLLLKTGDFSIIERRLEDYILKKTTDLFRADPLSIALVIAYIWAKLNEVVNLRIVVRGIEVAMPEERIRQALVFV